LSEHLATPAKVNLDDVAFTLQCGRKAFAHRRWVVAKTIEEARQALGTSVF
jgi:phthiocerol/phenolphthiocerol synthesis type-I polyketide synthase E